MTYERAHQERVGGAPRGRGRADGQTGGGPMDLEMNR